MSKTAQRWRRAGEQWVVRVRWAEGDTELKICRSEDDARKVMAAVQVVSSEEPGTVVDFDLVRLPAGQSVESLVRGAA